MTQELKQVGKGRYTLYIQTDPKGNMTTAGNGDLTIAEVLTGLELFKSYLIEQARRGAPTAASPAPALNPKRF